MNGEKRQNAKLESIPARDDIHTTNTKYIKPSETKAIKERRKACIKIWKSNHEENEKDILISDVHTPGKIPNQYSVCPGVIQQTKEMNKDIPCISWSGFSWTQKTSDWAGEVYTTKWALGEEVVREMERGERGGEEQREGRETEWFMGFLLALTCGIRLDEMWSGWIPVS